ncbi:MAG: ABC transporter ATP-binding protein [Candidatus Caldarchaeum sp.]|uniref:ABC transporter ATP-binding protein n=1 Tax=Caldiarchaeum subterraneum TaxID=311458 RepID=A0A7J3WDH0_CALS0
MYAVVAEGLWRFFSDNPVLRGVSLAVEEGGVYGLIGPNGAGKTTMFRILATLLRPSRGTAKVFGKDVVREASDVRRMIAYLPEEAGVYKNLTGRGFLKMVSRVYGLGSSALEQGVTISGLGEDVDRRMGEYSKGMRRRILLAGCLMVKPRLAILDEPTAGLDVEHSVYVRKIISQYAEQGTTFIVSSHNMLEVDYLCDRIALIHRGSIIAEGKPRELTASHNVQNLEELFVKKMGEAP